MVWRYHATFASLVLRVSRADNSDKFWLGFHSVGYFDGPTGWNGANFNISSREEHASLHEYLAPKPPHEWNELEKEGVSWIMENLRLYIVYQADRPNVKIRIVASSTMKISRQYMTMDDPVLNPDDK
jgi:hypothetical protein